MRPPRRKNLSGRRFGRLTVIKFSHCVLDRRYKYPGQSAYWLCGCVCGNQKIVKASYLLNGTTKSCGCLRKEYTDGKKKDNAKRIGESAFNNIYNKYKRRAKSRGLCFELNEKEALKLFLEPCYYCGQHPSNISKPSSETTGVFTYNGIDRKDNSKGYTLDNCVPCCKICNHAKYTSTVEDFDNWIKKIYSYRFGKALDMGLYNG